MRAASQAASSELMGFAALSPSYVTAVERPGQEPGGALRRVERPPGVEDEAVAVRMGDLDAAPADLLRAAMDRKGQGQAPALNSPFGFESRRLLRRYFFRFAVFVSFNGVDCTFDGLIHE
jgi:hypothetical protein